MALHLWCGSGGDAAANDGDDGGDDDGDDDGGDGHDD